MSSYLGKTSAVKLSCLCSGPIVKVEDTVFPNNCVIGPASRQQARAVISYHCANCGLKYEKCVIDKRLHEIEGKKDGGI